MIEFSKDGVALVLDPKTKIRLEINSPLFAEDVVEANKVYWFDLPMHPVNVKALGHTNHPEVSGKMRVYENYYLRIGGFLEMKGSLIVRSVSGKFRAAFTTNDLSQYKETLLTDFNWGDDITLGTTTEEVYEHAEAAVLLNYPDTDYNFPKVYNPSFYEDINPEFYGYINNFGFYLLGDRFYRNRIDIWDDFESEGTENPTGVFNVNTLVPMLYLQFVLTELADILAYSFTGEFFTDEDLQQILLYNDFALDWNEKEYWAQASDGDRSLASNQTLTFSQFTLGNNFTFDGTEITIDLEGMYDFYLEVGFSRVTTGTLAVRIHLFNVTKSEYYSVIVENTDLQYYTLSLYHSQYFDASNIGDKVVFGVTDTLAWNIVGAEAHVVNSTRTDLNRMAKTMNVKNHVPKMKLNEFLKDLKQFWGLALFVDSQSKIAQFSFTKDILDSASWDITSLVAEGQKIEVTENKNLSVDFEWDGSDAAIENNFLSVAEYTNLDNEIVIADAPRAKSLGETVRIAITNNYFKTSLGDLSERRWLFYSDISQRIFIDNGASDTTEVLLRANPMLMKNGVMLDDDAYIINEQAIVTPQVIKKGKSVLGVSQEEDKEEVLRFMNWVGLSPYLALSNYYATYPFATSSNYDLDKTKVKDITLFLEGPEGIYETYLKQWYEFVAATEEVTFNMGANFGPGYLIRLIEVISKPQSGSTTSNIRWIIIESIKYLPKKLSVEISMDGIESAELIAVKQAMTGNEIADESGS